MIFFRQLFRAAKLYYHLFLSLPVWYCSTIVSLFRFKNLELPLRLYFCKFFHIYNLFPFNFKVIKQLFVKFLKIVLCFTSSSHIQPINNDKLPLGHSSNVLRIVEFYCSLIETLKTGYHLVGCYNIHAHWLHSKKGKLFHVKLKKVESLFFLFNCLKRLVKY